MLDEFFKRLPEVAQAEHGVEIVVVTALAIIVCALFVFLFQFYTEARRYDVLRDESVKSLAETVQRYTESTDDRFKDISEALGRIESNISAGVESLSAAVKLHTGQIAEHETRLNKIDTHIGSVTVTAKPLKTVKKKKS